jgi:hypothetical protein
LCILLVYFFSLLKMHGPRNKIGDICWTSVIHVHIYAAVSQFQSARSRERTVRNCMFIIIIIIIIITIIIIIIIFSFMQGIHTRIPETNHVPRGYIVASFLSLLFMLPLFLVPALALLFFYVSTFQSMCAVPNTAVFCSSLMSWFPGISLTYFLNYYYYYYYYYYYFRNKT